MSQLHARLFEKWLTAGGDFTFSEWLTHRREAASRERAQRKLYGKLANVALGQQQLAALQHAPYQLPRIASALGGIFGGIFQ